MLLAIVLSALVLFGWTFVSETYFPTASAPSTKMVDGKQVALPKPQADPTADSPAAIRDRRVVLAETPRLPVETPSLRGTINLQGARIDDLVLKRHTQDMRIGSPPVRLLSPAGAPQAYFAQYGWTGEGVALPGPNTVWTASGDRLAPGRPVRLSWDNGTGQVFTIDLSVDESYMFSARQSVTNRGGGAVAVKPYALVNRAQAPNSVTDADSWTMHIGPVGVFNGAVDYETDYDTLAEVPERRIASTGGWLGFTDKYWLTALVPDQRSSVDAAFRRTGQGGFQADASPAPTIVAPGGTSSYGSRFFAGAKEIRLLDRYADGGIPLFERAIDWGWFRWFMKPIFYLLDWLFAAIGNFGVAIICLTVIVRALVFPLAQRQFKSMAAMRVVQPKMKVIQERFKDDKARQQQEMLKLYQTEKINPLAGCLPILVQIPIWYALYKVLLIAVEMRHQPFVGWIKDLAAPDPLTPVNLFGFLAFTPPAFLAVGILPIIVGITMWLQFKLNPQPTDPIQAQVFAIMPWVLMFVMAPFAAGLQLYWATSNLLTIAQQKWLYSRYPGMKESAAAAT
jgi:YidC/Oxa1 family membrane protein insertase